MAETILIDGKFYLDGFDLSGDTSIMGVSYGAEAPERFTMGNDTAIVAPGGRKTAAFQHEVLFQVGADQTDEVLFGKVGVNNAILLSAAVGDEGNADATFMKVVTGTWNPIVGEGGDLLKGSIGGTISADSLVRVTILHDRETARTATFNGTAFQVGAVPAGQKLFAVLQVLAASGGSPTLDVTVESDNAGGFASPVTQATFTQATARSAQVIVPIVGPITDDWWRIAATIGGAGPSFTFVVGIGIQP